MRKTNFLKTNLKDVVDTDEKAAILRQINQGRRVLLPQTRTIKIQQRHVALPDLRNLYQQSQNGKLVFPR